MYLTRHATLHGPRWAVDGEWLPTRIGLDALLQFSQAALADVVRALPRQGPASGNLLAPVEPGSEVWAAGVTYLRSREAREAESTVSDVYTRVYDAVRPELFVKAVGWRVVGHGDAIRIRGDSAWNVPEPELTVVINALGEIVGYTAGDDVSSRNIEGQNPLYLPQAKVYDGSCALGPGIVLAGAEAMRDLAVRVTVTRADNAEFDGETRTSQMKRTLEELVANLAAELTLPGGAFLMTGTGIVPPEHFTLTAGDRVRVTVGTQTLENVVASVSSR